MKIKSILMSCMSLILMALSLTSCHKDMPTQNDVSLSVLTSKINVWLDEQKIGLINSSTQPIHVSINAIETKNNSAIAVRNNNIDLLKSNLDFDAAIQSQMNRGNDYILVPIKDAIKKLKHVDQSASLHLVLITDKGGNIISGNIVCYLPKDGEAKGEGSSSNIITSIFKGKIPSNNGMLRFLSITGRWINQIEFNKSRITSYGTITNKKPNSSIISNSTYIAWYLVTTFYYSDGTTEQISEYVGSTCVDCYNSDYPNLYPVGGGNGSTPDSYDPTVVEYTAIENASSADSGDEYTTFTESGDTPDVGTAPIVIFPAVRYVHSYELEIGYNHVGVPIKIINVQVDPATVENTQVDVLDIDGHPCRRNITLFSSLQGGYPLVGPTAWVWWSYWVHADFYHNGVPFPSRNWPREKSFVAGP